MAKFTEVMKNLFTPTKEANTLFGNTTLGNDIVRVSGGSTSSSQQLYVTVSGTTNAGRTLSLTEASRNATVKTCLDFRARTFAQLPVKVMCELDNGRKVDALTHPEVSAREKAKAKSVLGLLNDPNNFQSRFEFGWQLGAWTCLTGEGFVLWWRKNQESSTETPIEMYVMDSTLMTATINSTRYPIYKVSSPTSAYFSESGMARIGVKDSQDFQTHQITHIKEQPWQGSAGFNKVTQAVELIALDQDIDIYSNFVMKNGAKITGVFKTDQIIPDEIFKQVEQRLKNQLADMANANPSNPSQAGTSLLLDQGADFSQLQMMKITDADLVALKEMTTRRICALFGIPPAMLGLAGGSGTTFNNTQALMDEYYKSTLYPFLMNVEEKYTKSLLGGYNRLCIHFDTSTLLKGSVKDQADLAIALTKAGIWTVNEARCYLGDAEAEDEHADKLHIPINGTSGAPEPKIPGMSPQDTGGGGGPSGAVASSKIGQDQ